MKVKEIFRYSDEACDGAEVKITDGQLEVLCFCYPQLGKLTIGQLIGGPLHAMVTDYEGCSECELKYSNHILAKYNDDIQKSDQEIYEIKKLSSWFGYHITARVVNQNDGVVAIGKIFIEVGSIPYSKEGEFITFHCSRIDIW